MLRAVESIERGGVAAVGIFGQNFEPMARTLAEMSGLFAERIAVFPGVFATMSAEDLSRLAVESLVPQIVAALTSTVAAGTTGPEDVVPAGDTQRDDRPVFRGSLDAVHDHFLARGWTDGLPIVPPTADRLAAFLAHTGRDPDDVVGVLPPAGRPATVRSVAVNGVMAGCRPEYLPVLLAVVECLADARFKLQDAGSTPGWEPLVVISGPLVRELEFNAGTAAMRVGRQANTSIGRFTRLYLRNVAGLRIPPEQTDQAGFGSSFLVVMAEDDDAVRRIGWPSYRSDWGASPEQTVVTVQSMLSSSPPIYTSGVDPADHLRVLSLFLGQAVGPQMVAAALKRGEGYQVLAMSPAIADVLARTGLSKADVAQFLYENTRVRVDLVEYLSRQGQSEIRIDDLVARGRLDPSYAESDDPAREVRMLLSPQSVRIVITGNPGRNQSRAYAGNHAQGPPIARIVQT